MSTIIRTIFEFAERKPDQFALINGDICLSYYDLCEQILRVADYLKKKGVKEGDRVVIVAIVSSEFVVCYLAVHLLSAIAVPVSPTIVKSRLEEIIELTNACCVVLDVNRISMTGFPCYLSAKNFIFPDEEEIAEILFTTGTTGVPKGVTLTHRNIRSAAENINEFILNTGEEREIIALPLCHSFGLARLRCQFLKGGTAILSNGPFLAHRIIQLMKKWQATGLSVVPSGMDLLWQFAGDRLGEFCGDLKYIELGSASMSQEAKMRLLNFLPKTRICMHYGLTEASRSAFIEFHSSRSFLTSIGNSAPNVSLRIIDSNFNELSDGMAGQISVKGEHVMLGYWRNGRIDNQSTQEGWFQTGDLGYKDSNGYFYLIGRESEVINVGGRKVSPIEVEEAVMKIDGIEECACVGVPDPRGLTGETVKVFVKTQLPQLSEADMINFLRTHLESFQIPTQFEWVDFVPKTESGKIKRAWFKKTKDSFSYANNDA